MLSRFLLAYLLLPVSLSYALTGFENESEVGIVMASGNSSSESYNLRQLNRLRWGANGIRLDGRYLESRAEEIQTANSWLLSGRLERDLTEFMGLVLGQGAESDTFAGYRQRDNTDVGLKWQPIKKGEASRLGVFFEAGYRSTHERRVSGPSVFSQLLRAYFETERQLAETSSARLWVEYLPNLESDNDYRLNSEFSLSSTLTSMFSLKVSYLIRYDNDPPPAVAEKTDTLLSTSLVAKF